MNTNPLQANNAEKSVIGAILRNPGALTRLGTLTPDDFLNLECRRAFEAAVELNRAHGAIDLLTLESKIIAMFGGGERADFLVECMTSAPASANAPEYAKLVRDASVRRGLCALSEKMAQLARDAGADISATASEIRNELRGMMETGSAWVSIGEVMLAAYEDCEARMKGENKPLLTGVGPLDAVMGGLWPGELTLIGARPAVGKSAFALQIAVDAALHSGKRVCFASAEMVDVQIGQRLIARGARINAQKLRKAEYTAEEFSTMASALNVYGCLPAEFLFATKYVEDIYAETIRKHDLGECDVLIVDYLQLLRTRHNFREDRLRVGYISKMLKSLTTELKIPVVALAQVRRQNTGGKSRCPALEDLRDSGELEQDADNVIFLHRPDSADDKTIHKDDIGLFRSFCQGNDGMQYIVLNVEKQRQGRTGIVAVLFDGGKMAYRAIERRREETA